MTAAFDRTLYESDEEELKMKVNLNQVYDEVCRRVDTEGTQINAAEAKRVIACTWDVLGEVMEDEGVSAVLDVVVKGIQRANDR